MSAIGLACIKAKQKAIQKQPWKINQRLKGFNHQVKRVTNNIKHITAVTKVQTGTEYSTPLKKNQKSEKSKQKFTSLIQNSFRMNHSSVSSGGHKSMTPPWNRSIVGPQSMATGPQTSQETAPVPENTAAMAGFSAALQSLALLGTWPREMLASLSGWFHTSSFLKRLRQNSIS